MRAPPAVLLLIAVACAGPTTDKGSVGQIDDSTSVIDTGAPLEQVGGTGVIDTGPEPEDTDAGGYDGSENADLYTLDRVVELNITLSSAAMTSLSSDPRTFVEGAIDIDGDHLDSVGVRLGGKYGSSRTLSQKTGFVIDIDRYDPKRDWRGLERLVVKNLVQDGSYVHERVAFQVYEAMGVPAPRVGYLWLKVNDVDFGLYANMEAVDDRFLSRSYDDWSGNLYDGDYWLAPDWSYYVLLDFNTTTQDMMQLEEGEDIGYADVHAVTDAINAANSGGSWMDDVGAVVDLEHHARYMAVEFWSGQYDGYSNYTNNYRVYFDPSDGKMRLSPWDHDWAFYDSNPMTPQYGLLSQGCFRDATCYATFQAAVEELCATLPGLDLQTEISTATELLTPYIIDDPRKEVSAETAAYYQRRLRQWVDDRYAVLASSYGVSCPTPAE